MNIAWYTYFINPWKDSRLKMWTHHADIMELLSKEMSIDLYPLIKPGIAKKINAYNSGDKSVVVDGYQNINIHFTENNDFSYLDNIDACFIEASRMFIFGTSDNKELSGFIKKIRYLMNRNIPILWYDGDGDLFIKKQGGDNFNIYLYNELNMSSYEKCTVIGPYEAGLSQKSDYVNINKFVFVPYNINFSKFLDNPVVFDPQNLKYLSTYFGNNFRRINFIEKFNAVANSNCGILRIYGDGWNPDKLDKRIELNHSIKLSIDDFIKYYNESLVGLYGSFQKGYEIKHYTLRVTEYLKAGLYIVPDNVPYLMEKFPEDNITIGDFYSNSVKIKLNKLKDNYSELVKAQREKLQETFDSRVLCKYYKEAWEV